MRPPKDIARRRHPVGAVLCILLTCGLTHRAARSAAPDSRNNTSAAAADPNMPEPVVLGPDGQVVGATPTPAGPVDPNAVDDAAQTQEELPEPMPPSKRCRAIVFAELYRRLAAAAPARGARASWVSTWDFQLDDKGRCTGVTRAGSSGVEVLDTLVQGTFTARYPLRCAGVYQVAVVWNGAAWGVEAAAPRRRR